MCRPREVNLRCSKEGSRPGLSVQSQSEVKTECDLKMYEFTTDVENRLVVVKVGGALGSEGLGGWGQQIQTITYRMDKQQSPTVYHRELYSL